MDWIDEALAVGGGRGAGGEEEPTAAEIAAKLQEEVGREREERGVDWFLFPS